MSPTCFEPRRFILRETFVYAVWCVYMHGCEQSGGQESVFSHAILHVQLAP